MDVRVIAAYETEPAGYATEKPAVPDLAIYRLNVFPMTIYPSFE